MSWVTLALSMVYLAAAVGMHKSQRLAWMVGMPLLAFQWINHGLWFGSNLFAFSTSHPLYHDSPATILVVLISSCFGFFPASVLLVLLFGVRKHVWRVLAPPRAGAP